MVDQTRQPQPINSGYQYQNRDFDPVNPQNQQMNPAQQQQMAQLQQQQGQPYKAANYSQYQAQPGTYVPVAIRGNSNPVQAQAQQPQPIYRSGGELLPTSRQEAEYPPQKNQPINSGQGNGNLSQAQRLAQLQQQQGQPYAAPRGQAYNAAPADQQWAQQTNQNMAGVPLATAPKKNWGATSSYYNAAMGKAPIDNTGYRSGGEILPTSRQEAEYPPQQPQQPINTGYRSGGETLPTSSQGARFSPPQDTREYRPQQAQPRYQSGGEILPTSRQEMVDQTQQAQPRYQSGGEILPTSRQEAEYRPQQAQQPINTGYRSGGEIRDTSRQEAEYQAQQAQPRYQSGGEILPTSRQEAEYQAQIQQRMMQQRNPPPMNGNYIQGRAGQGYL